MLWASRSERTRKGTQIEAKTISPPIVGVPAFVWCSCGPSSRMCWPNSRTRRNSMNLGPRKMQINIAAIPAIRTSPISDLHQLRQLLGDSLETSRARALDEDRIAGLQPCRQQLSRLVGVGDELVGVVVARGQADADHEVDPSRARVLPDLAVVARRVGPELSHLPQHRDRALGAERGEMVERRAHRHRVGVVAVVHEDDSAGKLQPLPTEAGESYARSAVGHTRKVGTEGNAGGDRSQGVGEVVRLGEGKVEALAAKRGGDKGFGDPVIYA